MEWDDFFFELSYTVAKKSKDPSTRVGAVIVGSGNEILSVGYNGFPRGVEDTHYRLANRETKYKLIEHAERNAIYNAARIGVSLLGSTLYVAWKPCHECARAIIQSGISTVVIGDCMEESLVERWADSWEYTDLMFREAGITLRQTP